MVFKKNAHPVSEDSDDSPEFIQDPPHKIKLGDQVRDAITGAEGIVVTYSKHLTGCDTVLVELPITAEGKMPIVSFDVTRLEVIQAGKLPKSSLPGFAKTAQEAFANQPVPAAG